MPNRLRAPNTIPPIPPCFPFLTLARVLDSRDRDFLLVTGSPRSGTTYTAAFLDQVIMGREPGLGTIGHERLDFTGPQGAHGFVNQESLTQPWYEVNWCAAPYLETWSRNRRVLTALLVRDPIATINSIHQRGFLGKDTKYGVHARGWYEYETGSTVEDTLDGAAKWWWVWTVLALKGRPHALIRVEGLERLQRSMAQSLGMVELPTDLNKNAPDPERGTLNWLDELQDRETAKRVEELGLVLGYEG